MNIEGVVTKKGKKPGKTLAIMGGVHGNEPCGHLAIKRALSEIEIQSGTIHFIYGNPRAITQDVRFTEVNLNRVFRNFEESDDVSSYEHQRARELMPFLKESEALLDIHSSSNPKSIPFIICEPHSFWIAERLAFPLRSCGWDAIEPGGTDYFVNQHGGCGICIECGNHEDLKAPERAFQSIITFLTLMGAIDGLPPSLTPHQREVNVYSLYRTKNNFTPSRDFADFELLQEGECIGHDGDIPLYVEDEKSVIIFAKKITQSNQEAFILGRERQVDESLT